MQKLFLHIGLPKTATTTIQNFLILNHQRLIEKGWLYPVAARQYMAHHLLGNFFRTRKLDWIGEADPEQVKADLLAEIRATKCDNVIMSTESLISATQIADIRAYFSDFEVEVVVFLRRQDDWLESAYQERLKNGPKIASTRRYLTSQIQGLDYYKMLRSWADVFGNDHIRVGLFERSAERLSVEETFLRLIGAGMDPDYVMPEKMNSRLNRDCLAFFGRMPETRRVGLKFTNYAAVLREYSEINPDAPEWKKAWSPAERREIMERFAASNERVARKFLGREDGQLFQGGLPDLDEPWAPYPGLSVAKAAEIGLFLADHLYCELSKGRVHKIKPPVTALSTARADQGKKIAT